MSLLLLLLLWLLLLRLLSQDVTNENVKEYVRLKAQRELLGQRVPHLEAMRRGFNDIPLAAHLRLFSVFDLMSTVCGKLVRTPPLLPLPAHLSTLAATRSPDLLKFNLSTSPPRSPRVHWFMCLP